MTDITTTMSADHRICDEVFARAEELIADGNWDEGTAKFKVFHDAMEHHFTMEETVLFPAFETRTGMTMGPTEVMRGEHVQMRGLFAEMAESVEKQDSEQYLGLSETLLMVMQQHNSKEEQMLYRMADQALGQGVEDVLERMAAVGQ
ncbi:MAG: hemerythrin domain-containing protein [Candidatus Polarisedimenticolaceae bacterium]|nr:hemerythrin domain-containing protein [Candidatus Polarisedimenticolaceae bacterium]